MSIHHDRLPHDWRHLDVEALTALIPNLSDNDADLVDCEIASRPTVAPAVPVVKAKTARRRPAAKAA